MILASRAGAPEVMRTGFSWKIFAIVPLLALAGCESFGRGVTQAVLEGTGERPRTRAAARSRGGRSRASSPTSQAQDKLPPFGEGVGDRPEVKVLYVHGIGTHVPGDGTTLRQTLAKSLGLDIRAPRPKRIVIASPNFPNQNLGEINVTRLTDEPRRRDLLFYELTWSPITQPDKDLIAFDKEQDYVLRRAAVNQAMRSFVNDVAPDPLAYAGQKREPILVAVTQSICWMVSRSWSELPELTEGSLLRRRPAGLRQPGAARRLRPDHPQPGQPGDAGRDAAADQPAGLRRPAPQADRRRLRAPRHPGVHAVQPAAAARGRARGPAGDRPDRRLLRAGRDQARALLRARPRSSRSPTPTT